jgi:uncharacterized membrane protein YqjE
MTTRPSNNGSATSSDHAVGEFIDDLMTLTELHANLAVVEFKETVHKAALPLGLVLVSLTVMAASVPVVLMGLAQLLATRLNLQLGWAMIVVASAALALASPVAVLGLVHVRRSSNGFRDSRAELRRNAAWLRGVLIARKQSHSQRDR